MQKLFKIWNENKKYFSALFWFKLLFCFCLIFFVSKWKNFWLKILNRNKIWRNLKNFFRKLKLKIFLGNWSRKFFRKLKSKNVSKSGLDFWRIESSIFWTKIFFRRFQKFVQKSVQYRLHLSPGSTKKSGRKVSNPHRA